MVIGYLDESGSPEQGANTEHFVLLGLAVPAAAWKAKDHQVQRVKDRYGLSAAEIHTAWMLRDYPEQATVPSFDALNASERSKAVLGVRALNLARTTRKTNKNLIVNHRKTEPYVHLTRAECVACVTELTDVSG